MEADGVYQLGRRMVQINLAAWSYLQTIAAETHTKDKSEAVSGIDLKNDHTSGEEGLNMVFMDGNQILNSQ
jgi:hypothetical protein